MTSSPIAPRLRKGAIVTFNLFNPLASVVVFQYNPDTLTRNLKAKQPDSKDAEKAKGLPLKGLVETINLDIELDATDQLEKADGIATSMGIYPQLSALEMLMYPDSTWIIANLVQMALGAIKMEVPSVDTFTLFIWGPKRVLPVRVDSFTIIEQAHDVNLNPIRAKVSLGMTVLNYDNLSMNDPGFWVFLSHQAVKQAMAAVGNAGGLSDIGSVM